MKYFNSREKAILKILSEIDVNNGDTFSKILSDKYFTKSRGIWIIVDPEHKTVKAFYNVKDTSQSDASGLRKIQLNAFNTTLELRILIEYLIEQKLIYIVELGGEIDTKQSLYSEFIGNIPRQPEEQFDRLLLKDGRHDLYDNEILDIHGNVVFKSFEMNEFYNSITKNWLNGIYVTEELKQFVLHEFKTKEEFRDEKLTLINQRQFKKSQRVAWTAIAVSLVIGLVTQIFNYINKKEYSKKLESHIQKEKNKLSGSQLKMDSISKVLYRTENQLKNLNSDVQTKYSQLDSNITLLNQNKKK